MPASSSSNSLGDEASAAWQDPSLHRGHADTHFSHEIDALVVDSDDDEDGEGGDEEESCDSAVCIVCQVRGEQEPTGTGQNKNQGQGQSTGSFGQRKIGYIAFSQFSRAWNSKVQFQSGMRLADDIETPLTSKMMDGDVHLSFCGHGKSVT